MEIKYCIGKATRSPGKMACVRKPPFEDTGRSNWAREYIELRCAVFDTVEEAETACRKAAQYNPIGFHVLRVVGDAWCSECEGTGGIIPERVKRGEVAFFSEWEYDICPVCDGTGYIDNGR